MCPFLTSCSIIIVICIYPSSEMLNCKFQCLDSSLIYATLLGLLHFSVGAAQIPLDSRITLVDNNNWVSSNGDFAIGFLNYSGQPNQYSFGIYFSSSSIPFDKRTVVWPAGNVFGNDSSFHLTTNGNLQLIDSSTGAVAWTSNTTGLGVSFALLCDDGNLVLMNNKSEIVWQSFRAPSDTLLPGQSFHPSQNLRANRISGATTSFYSLIISESGQLELRFESRAVYWKSSNPSIDKNLSAVVNINGMLQLLDEKSQVIWSVFADDHNDTVKFRFLRVDLDGNLRLYSWDEDSKSWRSSWQAVENQCEVFATCGFHGVCGFNESGSTVCKCPFGVATDAGSKCLAPYAQKCDTSTNMVTYKHTSLYGLYQPNDSVVITDLQQCKNSCLEDPVCTAVTFLNDGTARCSMKMTRFISGYSDPSVASVSFVKICSDPLAVLPMALPPSAHSLSPSSLSSYSEQSYGFVVACLIGAAFGTFCVVAMAQISVGVWLYRKSNSRKSKFRTTFSELNSAGFIGFTYHEIKEVTSNFMYQIKPNLFKGTLHSNETVMVKQIRNSVDEKTFKTSVAIIGSIYHKGLTKLEGYCFEQPDHRFLVYEYLKNGTLEKCLRDHKSHKRELSWRKRVNICLSVGRAVSYLHTGCREFISHGNLRCENVVIDDNLEAKVTEYGLRKILGKSESESLSSSGGPAERDVKDFGMIVLDLITGTLNTEDSCELLFENWVQGQVESVVDEEVELEEVERMLRIAFWCLQGDERLRPSMGEVVKVLEGILTVDPPPNPFVFRQYLEVDEASSEGEIEDRI